MTNIYFDNGIYVVGSGRFMPKMKTSKLHVSDLETAAREFVINDVPAKGCASNAPDRKGCRSVTPEEMGELIRLCNAYNTLSIRNLKDRTPVGKPWKDNCGRGMYRIRDPCVGRGGKTPIAYATNF